MAILAQNPALSATQPGSSSKTLHEYAINDSTYLSAVKYDSSTLQCTVVMKKGGEYTYYMVFPMVIDQWMQSGSKGEFYSKQIRGKYKSARIINKTVGRSEEANHGKSGRDNHTGKHHAGRHRPQGN